MSSCKGRKSASVSLVEFIVFAIAGIVTVSLLLGGAVFPYEESLRMDKLAPAWERDPQTEEILVEKTYVKTKSVTHQASVSTEFPVVQAVTPRLLPTNAAIAIATATTTSAGPLRLGEPVLGTMAAATNVSSTRGSGEDLWAMALSASVARGIEKNGKVVGSRVTSYESKRVGPKRHDGKAWKAGEAGCPPKPIYKPLEGKKLLVQGDERLVRLHFVHPPKSGGTSFGQTTIAVACELNSQYRDSLDCCQPPADWCGENCEPLPDCKAIYGCGLCHCHHIPRLHRIEDATYSVTIIRHPGTRYISGFFYRAHSPNWDRFGLRPGYFSKDPVYPFKFSFEQYLEMPEYHNILVKMFARNEFPYFNATLTLSDVAKAKSVLSKFLVVGVNEAYEASVQLLLKLTGVTNLRDDQIHLPPSMTSSYSADHEKMKVRVKEEPWLAAKIHAVNRLDMDLYEWGVVRFCEKVCAEHLGHFDLHGVCSC